MSPDSTEILGKDRCARLVWIFFWGAVVFCGIMVNARILNVWTRLECVERGKPCPEKTAWQTYWDRP